MADETLAETPAVEAEQGEGRGRELGGRGAGMFGLLPEGEQLSAGEFDGGGVAAVAGAVVGKDDGFGPGAALVSADPGVIAAGRAAVAVGHQQIAVAEA